MDQQEQKRINDERVRNQQRAQNQAAVQNVKNKLLSGAMNSFANVMQQQAAPINARTMGEIIAEVAAKNTNGFITFVFGSASLGVILIATVGEAVWRMVKSSRENAIFYRSVQEFVTSSSGKRFMESVVTHGLASYLDVSKSQFMEAVANLKKEAYDKAQEQSNKESQSSDVKEEGKKQEQNQEQSQEKLLKKMNENLENKTIGDLLKDVKGFRQEEDDMFKEFITDPDNAKAKLSDPDKLLEFIQKNTDRIMLARLLEKPDEEKPYAKFFDEDVTKLIQLMYKQPINEEEKKQYKEEINKQVASILKELGSVFSVQIGQLNLKDKNDIGKSLVDLYDTVKSKIRKQEMDIEMNLSKEHQDWLSVQRKLAEDHGLQFQHQHVILTFTSDKQEKEFLEYITNELKNVNSNKPAKDGFVVGRVAEVRRVGSVIFVDYDFAAGAPPEKNLEDHLEILKSIIEKYKGHRITDEVYNRIEKYYKLVNESMPTGKNAIASLHQFFSPDIQIHGVTIPNSEEVFSQLINEGFTATLKIAQESVEKHIPREQSDEKVRDAANELTNKYVEQIKREIKNSKEHSNISDAELEAIGNTIKSSIETNVQNYMLALKTYFIVHFRTENYSIARKDLVGNMAFFDPKQNIYDVDTDNVFKAFDAFVASFANGSINWVRIAREDLGLEETVIGKQSGTTQESGKTQEAEREMER